MTLYYQPEQCGAQLVDTAGSGEEVWAKVTVEPQSGGGLRILSNQICGRPDDLLGVTRLLTGEELAFFNTEFFNSQTTNESGGAAHAPQPVPHLPVQRAPGDQPVRSVL